MRGGVQVRFTARTRRARDRVSAAGAHTRLFASDSTLGKAIFNLVK